MIIDSTSFHPQRYSGLKDRLDGYPSHRLFEQEIQAYILQTRKLRHLEGKGLAFFVIWFVAELRLAF